MQNITSIAGLKSAIQLLEDEQDIKGQILKEQFYLTLNSFKPVNLLTDTLKEIVTSPYLADNIVGTVIGLITGSLSKRLLIGSSGNIFKKLIGSIMQIGVTNVVAKHSDTIRSIGQVIFQYILRKKEKNSNSRDR
jgi:hypothetical protein